MSRAPSLRRLVLREALLALLVLSLSFLSFAHQAIALPGADPVATTAADWCGAPIGSDDARHAPCHACRIGQGADLPAPSCDAAAVVFTSQSVFYALPLLSLDGPNISFATSARGPPLIV